LQEFVICPLEYSVDYGNFVLSEKKDLGIVGEGSERIDLDGFSFGLDCFLGYWNQKN
jgi:hypothetical protein